MATCFENLIGYKGSCDYEAPTSGLLLDQIGIHKHEIEKYIQTPYNNAADFYADMLAISINEVKSKIVTHFMPKYKARTIIDGGRIGYASDNMVPISGSAGTYAGIEVEMCNHDSPIELYVSEFSLFTDLSATVTVQVWDLNQNVMIDSFPVVTVANQISKAYPGKTYKANKNKLRLAFIYDISVTDSYKTLAYNGGCASCQVGTLYNINRWISTRGISVPSVSDKVPQNLTGLNHTAGASLIYSVNCAHEDWLCDKGNLIARPLLYAVGKNILEYGLNSTNRENSKVNDDRKQNANRVAAYINEYEIAMNNLLQFMDVPNDPQCYQCNNRIKSVISL